MRGILDNMRLDWRRRAAFLAVGISLVLGARVVTYHIRLASEPHQMEYREGAMLVQTGAYLKGLNPFSVGHPPYLSTQYGLVYNGLTAPLAASLGNCYGVHRAVSGISIVLAVLILIGILRRLKVPWAITVPAAFIWYATLLYYTTPVARPDGPGLLFLMLGIYLPWRDGYSRRTLAVSATVGILAFFTKLYFVLFVPVLAVYLALAVSFRRALGFAVFFLALFAASLVSVHVAFPSYFREVLLNICVGYDWRYLVHQNLAYLREHALLFAAWGIAWGVSAWRRIRNDRWLPSAGGLRQDSLFLACLAGSILVILVMGGNNGSWLTYYFQLITPFLLIVAAVSLCRHLGDATLAIVPVLWIALGVQVYRMPGWRSVELEERWAPIMTAINRARRVWNQSPVVTGILLGEGRPVWNSGLSEYFTLGILKQSALKPFLHPTDREVREIEAKDREGIEASIRARTFDLVVTDAGYRDVLLEQNYRVSGSFVIPMPHARQAWPIRMWVPTPVGGGTEP